MSTTEKVTNKLKDEGWKLINLKPGASYDEFLHRVKKLGEDEFILDFHLDFLLIFPKGAQFHSHELLINGSILLQEKVRAKDILFSQFETYQITSFSQRQVACQQWPYQLKTLLAK